MSDGGAGGLFDGVLARGRVREAVGDRAWLQAMLDFEAALARAEERAGLLGPGEAAAIAAACRAESFDLGALGVAAREVGNPAEPAVRALTAAVKNAGNDAAAGQVHRGATSQDVLDTAMMLVAQRALGSLLDDLEGAADAAAALAARHRATLATGRTLLQPALPTTFGLEAAAWLSGLDEAAALLVQIRETRLAVQLGGAAGTLASLGDTGPAVLAHLAEALGLRAPTLPWHTVRGRVGELAAALGIAAGAIGKAARDVTLLAQGEIGEVQEGEGGGGGGGEGGGEGRGGPRGGSSTLPHKHNPVAAVSALACAARAPGLVATLLAAAVQEHQRAAGAWQAEWRPFTELFETVGSAAAWLRDGLEHLEVDEARLRGNLDATRGLLLAERVSGALAPALGRLAAHDLVAAACAEVVATGRSLAEALAARPEVAQRLSPGEIARLLEPAGYLGSAGIFVDRALAAHAARRAPGRRGP